MKTLENSPKPTAVNDGVVTACQECSGEGGQWWCEVPVGVVTDDDFTYFFVDCKHCDGKG